ncbi:HNH endonuclease signature motif containing protein [Mycolicibacterium flavescens]|uniref:HNH endonuclease signature motif containing protein n=1 Tax=Mycolicibacterium flavescens TaxID=1776 RepID=UPI0009FCDCE1|nr:HNH endonuclease signature motif containing protein [Mycolicibacterium flavescens]
MYVRSMSGTESQDAMAGLRAAVDRLAGCDFDLSTAPELIAVLDELETVKCRLPAVEHRALARLQTETTPAQMGATNWRQVLSVRWRISTSEANRRLAEAELLAPRQAFTGEVLPPRLPATAAAQAHGLITAEHVQVIRKAMNKVPGFVDTATRESLELDLVRCAATAGPSAVQDTATLRLFLMDQDGPVPDEAERARKRSVTKSKQGEDGMVELRATMTPEAWAVWEVLFAKFAAPGMCNPADEEPCVSGTPSQAQIDNDHRSLSQRQHDAMLVVGRIALMSGDLGQLNGLPVSVIIRTTLQDLESRAGIGTTGGGTVVPIDDVVRMAAHARHYLAVFDRATGSALNLYRAKRVASRAQRIMLIARDGGCTKPGCTVGAYGCQAHHVIDDWTDGGQTNVDELGLACGPDNRSVNNDGGWTTRMSERHDVEWLPPPPLDTGQARLNYHHRPELLLRPDDDEEPFDPAAEAAKRNRHLHTDTTTPPAGAADADRADPVDGDDRYAEVRPAPTGLADEAGAADQPGDPVDQDDREPDLSPPPADPANEPVGTAEPVNPVDDHDREAGADAPPTAPGDHPGGPSPPGGQVA